MPRMIGAFLAILSASVLLLAQEPEVLQKKKKSTPPAQVEGIDAKAPGDSKDEAKKNVELKPLEKPKGEDPQGENAQSGPDRFKELISRLQGNLEKVEDRLDKKDPGKETVKLQEQIIRDLEELLKQNNKGGGGGGSCSCSNSAAGAGAHGGASARQAGKMSKSSQAKSGGGASQNQAQNPSKAGAGQKDDSKKKENGPDQLTKKEEKSKQDELSKKEDKGAGGKDDKEKKGDGSGLGQKDNKPKEKNTVADLFRNPWGILPPTKRQEMDAYSKEQFLSKYEELLKQYYRTIAEQGRTKGEAP